MAAAYKNGRRFHPLRVKRTAPDSRTIGERVNTGGFLMYWIFGIVYFVLMVSLGVMSLRKGHWVLFVVGIFLPLFWVIGAVMPPRVAAASY
ncbi:MAG: hypothetical protein ACRD12_01535 [Acidimicrobiales bacterium]